MLEEAGKDVTEERMKVEGVELALGFQVRCSY